MSKAEQCLNNIDNWITYTCVYTHVRACVCVYIHMHVCVHNINDWGRVAEGKAHNGFGPWDKWRKKLGMTKLLFICIATQGYKY